MAATALAAEAAGFDSGWVTHHLLVPTEMAPVYGTIAEVLVSLGFLAGRTRNCIHLGVSLTRHAEPLVALSRSESRLPSPAGGS